MQVPASSASFQSLIQWPKTVNTAITAIHGKGCSIASAVGSSEKENPVTRRRLANVSGHSSNHAIDRVISLNVNRPKSRSLISHSMKSLIQ